MQAFARTCVILEKMAIYAIFSSFFLTLNVPLLELIHATLEESLDLSEGLKSVVSDMGGSSGIFVAL